VYFLCFSAHFSQHRCDEETGYFRLYLGLVLVRRVLHIRTALVSRLFARTFFRVDSSQRTNGYIHIYERELSMQFLLLVD